MKIGQQIKMTLYVKPEQKAELTKLAKLGKKLVQEYLREGVDLVLKKHNKKKAK